MNGRSRVHFPGPDHTNTVPDPDLEIRGGGGHPHPQIRGGRRSPKQISSALGASKIKVGGGGLGLSGSSPGSATAILRVLKQLRNEGAAFALQIARP